MSAYPAMGTIGNSIANMIAHSEIQEAAKNSGQGVAETNDGS